MTVEEQVSELMQLVAASVSDIDTRAIPDGFRRSFPTAATTFRIHSVDPSALENRPMGIAEVVTVFDDRDLDPLDDWDTARANRWSVWGHARRTGRGQFEVRCRVILYRGSEAGWKTYAGALGGAFRQQAAMHIAALSSRLSRDEYLKWRNDLGRPREWVEAPPAGVWADVAQTVRERNGLISSVERDAVVFEVPLDEPARSGRRERPETALIRITSRAHHPIAGAGFLATLAIPRDLGAETAAWAEVLNAAEERESDFVPGFGAWSTSGIEDEDLVHSIFWPTQDGVRHAVMVDQLARWEMIRADWLGQTNWRQVAYGDLPPAVAPAMLPQDVVERTRDEVRVQLERLGVCPEEIEGGFAFAREPNRCTVQVMPTNSADSAKRNSAPRVVTTTELPERDVQLSFGREHVTNRLASTSALVTSRLSASIVASAPLSPRSFPIAGTVATWSAYFGGWSLLEGSRRIALGQPLPEEAPAETTWTNDDLVRINYDRAHVLGGGLASGWEYPYRLGEFGAVVRVQPIANHPALGGGLLCTLSVEGLEVPPKYFHNFVNALNQIEYDQNVIPFFGAWCEAPGNTLAFVMFLPNGFRDPDFTDYMIGSMTRRASRIIAAGPEAMIELLARVQKA